MGFCLLFLFFKQKTAYEMRISDWSSDVCSSDLSVGDGEIGEHEGASRIFQSSTQPCNAKRLARRSSNEDVDFMVGPLLESRHVAMVWDVGVSGREHRARERLDLRSESGPEAERLPGHGGRLYPARSDEHTSELKSLMRHPYA